MNKRFVLLVIFLTVALLLPAVILEFHEKTDVERLNNADVNLLLNYLQDNWEIIVSRADSGTVMT